MDHFSEHAEYNSPSAPLCRELHLRCQMLLLQFLPQEDLDETMFVPKNLSCSLWYIHSQANLNTLWENTFRLCTVSQSTWVCFPFASCSFHRCIYYSYPLRCSAYNLTCSNFKMNCLHGDYLLCDSTALLSVFGSSTCWYVNLKFYTNRVLKLTGSLKINWSCSMFYRWGIRSINVM